ncbi:hypothetical protein NC797_07995 [Aquibacillus sp. 3ASR75-11]|uniref:Uncharacterized protein n=1 Tax=Terrihalobacillus insolitus TaxID=2950438 RepID=A0A9X4AM47_9BACI|nr:hypothetical protein [Terrihalobacillus insolitus]MDC3424449.1 hypothetical protein [Terrihalobacillus insolitus]
MKRRAFTMSSLQVFSSPAFYLSIIGVTGLSFISIWERISASEVGLTVSYSLDIFVGLTMLKKLVVLFAALPYAASFCSDWKFQYIKPVVIRTGLNKYVWSKVFTCFLSGFLTVFIGLIIFITILAFKMPLISYENLDTSIFPPFGPLALDLPILYLLAKIFVFSLAAALWTVVGLTISAFIPIHFVAVAAPVIASYILEELTMSLPKWLNLYLLTRSANVIQQGALVSFTYFIFIFILFSVLAGMLFSYQVRRRIRNEVV